jgi:hypothetical protein
MIILTERLYFVASKLAANAFSNKLKPVGCKRSLIQWDIFFPHRSGEAKYENKPSIDRERRVSFAVLVVRLAR